MAQAVQIELLVDEKGAVQGIRAFDTSIKTTTANVKKLNTALAETSAASAGSSLKALEKEFTGGESSIRTMNAEIRSLQGSIFGDTRAAAEFLTTIKGVGAAMEIAFPVFGIMAVAGILVQAGEKAHELYDKYLSLTSAQRDYNAELAKAKEEDFGNTRSIETTIERINEATDAAKKYNETAQALGKTSLFQIGAEFFSNPSQAASDLSLRMAGHSASQQAVDEQKQVDKLTPKKAEQTHEENVAQIELNHALDGELRGQQKINAELAKRRELAAETRRYNNEEDAAHGNTVAKDAGAGKEKIADQTAQREADAQLFNLRRDQAHELMQLHNQATDAQLRGSALYEAQEAQAIEELKFKDMDSMAARTAVHEKFHAEEMRRLQDEQNATQMIQARAAMAGMTGIQKIQAEGEIQVGQIRGNDNLSDSAKDARVAAARMQTQAEILQRERQFSDQVDSLAEQSASHQVSGFARIRAEGTKQLDELQKKFDETYGHMDMTAPGAAGVLAQGRANLARGQAAIRGGTQDQLNELAGRKAAETQQIEDEARMRSLSGEKQKTAAIEAEYKQRLDKYQQELQQQEISQEDYNRRVAAAAEQRDAEMVEAAKQTRQKMASEFDSFFRGMNHPLQELASLGEKAAGQAAAEMVQRVQQRGIGHATHGSLFGGIFGGHGKSAGADLAAEMSGSRSTAASSVFSVSSATIHVGAAQIAFGGMAGAGSSRSASFGGSTASFGGGGFVGGGSTGFGGGSGFGFGGAGSGGTPEAAARTTGGVMPSSGAGAGGVMGDLSGGLNLFGQAKSTFAGGGSKGAVPFSEIDGPNDPLGLNKSGAAGGAKSGGMLQGGGFGSNAMGAAGGALGMFSAFEGNGGVGGALGGAMSGMQLGMSLGGPVGAAVGAAAGAVIGAIGFGGREKARVYDLKQVRPRITADQDSYAQGGMDYLSAYSDMQSLDMEAKKATNKMGPAAQSYYQDTIKGEIRKAEQQFTREQKAGRSMYTVSAASYDVGTSFVPETGWNLNHRGERIIPSDENRQITRALNMHSSYLSAMRSGGAGGRSTPAGDTHLHFHAHDSKTAMQFLMANKHVIRSAVNASYAENSGGSDA